MSHDYVRHGTIDLYAALNLATGVVTHQLAARNRAVEFQKFMNLIDRSVPAGGGGARRVGQLLHAPDLVDPTVAGPSPPLPVPLHVHQLVMDEPRGTVVRGDHQQMDPARHAPQRQRTSGVDHRAGPHLDDDPRPYLWHKTFDEILDSLSQYCERISDSGH
jgi:hypothetical protein